MVAQRYRWDFIGLSTDEKPTAETSPKVTDGSTFYCSDTSQLYVWCNDQWYEKTATGGGGGGGPTVVQTIGTSTTDVMSQNAVGKAIYDAIDSTGRGYRPKIGDGAYVGGLKSMAIGDNSRASGQNGVALGGSATALKNGSIALGYGATTSSVGEMNIGTSSTSYGYNSSNYRLLSGLYDGQNAHDAVTVNQVNSVIDAINTALSTNIPHIGA